MPFQLLKRKRTCMIIKDHVIRYATLKEPNIDSVVAFGEHYLPNGIVKEGKIVEYENFSLILDECVRDWGIKGQPVYFCVPDSSVVIRTIDDIPVQLPNNEIRNHLKLVVGESIHLPFENPVFDFAVSVDTESKKEVILIAAPESSVFEIRDAMEGVKLKPVAADLTSLSLYRLFYELAAVEGTEHILLAQFDMHALNVTIFHEHQPVFNRHTPTEIDETLWELKVDDETKKTNLVFKGEDGDRESQFQELIRELERLMNFYRFSLKQGKEGISKVVLTGDSPFLQQINEQLHETLSVPIITLEEELVTKSNENIPNRFNDVIGLALKKTR